MKTPAYLACSIAALIVCAPLKGAAAPPSIELQALSSMAASTPATATASPAQIVAHDPGSQQLFVVNAAGARIDVFNILDPENPIPTGSIIIPSLAPELAGSVVSSVAVHDGIIAVAAQASPKTKPGFAVFLDTARTFLGAVQVGAFPDMITFTKDGRFVLTANEGEPSSYPSTLESDPEGSVSIIDLSAGAENLTQADVRTVGFTAYNSPEGKAALLADGVRIFGPGASVAQDLEPEYIATSHDSKTAWVTLQENNALAIIDIPSATLTRIAPLGVKNHGVPGSGIDASDKDSAINIIPRPNVVGMYEPDAIASYKVGSETFLVLANEGDVRDWPGFKESDVAAKIPNLDPARFGAAEKNDANLGRLVVTKVDGDTNGDGKIDTLHAFGARSFSIRRADGTLVWDSGDQFEKRTAEAFPSFFNVSNSSNTFDTRSDDKGPEPEGVAVGKAFGRTYAFISLERIGGVMVYDVSNPYEPTFTDYVNNRDFALPVTDPNSGDLGPEGLIFISGDESPNGEPLVVVANEISGTTTIYQVSKIK